VRWLSILVLLLIVVTVGCQKPVQQSATWTTPKGEWRVNATGGRNDLFFRIVNEGPGSVQLTRLVRADAPDFSSVKNLLASVLPPDADPPTKVRILTALVHRWFKQGERIVDEPRLYNDIIIMLTALGQGYSDDVARLLAGLCQEAGLEASLYDLNRHLAVAVKWDGAWHMADPRYGVVFAEDNGRVLTLRELALRPDVISASLRRTTTPKGVGDIIDLYKAMVRFEEQSRFRMAAVNASPLKPWPLPPGAELHYKLGEQESHTGAWRFSLPDPQGRYTADAVMLSNMTVGENGIVAEQNTERAEWRLNVDLPFPVVGVELRLHVKPSGERSFVGAFVYGGENRPSNETQFLSESFTQAKSVSAMQSFTKPLIGSMYICLFLSPGAIIDSVDLTLKFTHASAAVPHVAGENVTLYGEATSFSPATLTVTHGWK